MEKGCRLCPRECGADRKYAPGFCGCFEKVRVAHAGLHLWEEPCICPPPGSGAVFFSGCPLRCVYCQNFEISQKLCGKIFTPASLSDLFLSLQNEKGAANINLVTASPYVPAVVNALKAAKKGGLRIPVIYNTSGYEKVETLKMFDGLVDVYLPDLKYFSPALSALYSAAPDYFAVAKAALREMARQAGKPVFQDGILKNGVIVRHLVLPGSVSDSLDVLSFLFDAFGKDGAVLSLMSQYFPTHRAADFPALSRRITRLEYQKAVRFAEEKGFEWLYTQSRESAKKDFVPDFSWKDAETP